MNPRVDYSTMPATLEEPAILEQLRNDHELIARLKITATELEKLSKCSLLGTLTCKNDMLFILRQIREATTPGDAMHAAGDPSASAGSGSSMRPEDALRKIRLLRQVKAENGASAAEAENAARLAKTLMDRYTIKAEDSLAAQNPAISRLTWVYWQELFNEFRIEFSRFGYRGIAALSDDRTVYIQLGSGQWSIEKRSNGGAQTVARNRGLDSLREYLKTHARTYSLFKH